MRTGNQLTQPEFHKRYQAMPPQFRAELLQGVVIVPSPIGRGHAKNHANLMGWITLYRADTPQVLGYDNVTVMLNEESEVQPDAALMLPPEVGGQARFQGEYVSGAPELVAEVAASSTLYDLGIKKNEYERQGVQEYLVVMSLTEEVRWFYRQENRLAPMSPDPDGIYRSKVFPGLWLDPQALFDDNIRTMFDVLRQGLASPEHAAFAARLQAV